MDFLEFHRIASGESAAEAFEAARAAERQKPGRDTALGSIAGEVVLVHDMPYSRADALMLAEQCDPDIGVCRAIELDRSERGSRTFLLFGRTPR
jgi:hypothetical protein